MAEAAQQGQGQGMPEGAQSDGTQVQGQDAESRTFSQADLNKIAANEKRDGTKAGRQAAISELLEKTGAESLDDVLSAYTEYQGIQEAVTTEADREKERADRLEKRTKAAEERYTQTLQTYALRDALRDAGINPERLKGAMRLADLSAIEVDKEGNVSGVESVVESVQEEAPEWFGSQERQRINAPQTTGTGVQSPGGAATEEDVRTQMGASLLRHIQDGRSRSSGGNRFS